MAANETTAGNGKLTAKQEGRLARLEAVVLKGERAFLDAAVALYEIEQKKLFSPAYESLLDYALDRFDFDQKKTGRYRRAGRVLAALKGCDVLPVTESQARELSPLDGEVLKKVWLGVVARSQETGERINAAVIREEVGKVFGRTVPAEIVQEVVEEMKRDARPPIGRTPTEEVTSAVRTLQTVRERVTKGLDPAEAAAVMDEVRRAQEILSAIAEALAAAATPEQQAA